MATSSYPAAGPSGYWKVQAKIEGRISEHVFAGGTLPAATFLKTSVSPLIGTATTTTPATFNVVVTNTGTTPAIGCSLAPDTPLAAVPSFQVILAGVPQGYANKAFNIAAGGSSAVRLTVIAKTGYHATQTKVPLRVICTNASEPSTSVPKVVTLTY